MLDTLYRSVLIPAFESGLKRRQTFAHWRRLEKSQWLSPAELAEQQLQSLQKFIQHAAANCPYYRDTWSAAGLSVDSLRHLSDFSKWPLIDRDVIRANRQTMRSQVPGYKLIKKATGGSSGIPLEFDIDLNSYEQRFGAWYRGYGWAGAAPGTRQWWLWGVALGNVPRKQQWKDALYAALYRRRIANCFELSESEVPRFLADLNACRPANIVAYTNPLYSLARSLDERKLVPWSPRSIVVGAEKLHDFQRELIERVFRAPVFETYGSREFMLIGAECDRHNGLHLTQENLLVEVVEDDGSPTPAGQEGNVVITDLTNFGMPFIRYVNGDRAIAGFEQCTCGRGLPLLKKVVGRTLDMLDTPDGRHIPGEFFPHLLKEYSAVRRFQVVQEDSAAIQLRLVVNGDWTEDARLQLEQQVREVAGPVVNLEIALVDDIPLTRAGKLQVVVRRRQSETSAGLAAHA